MKYELYKAVDKIDGDLSVFVFDENDNYTVIFYSDYMLGRIIDRIKKGCGCDWPADSIKYPRRNDMINPALLCEIES